MRGKSLVNIKQYEKALPDFDRALELDPKAAKPYHGKGTIYYFQKKYKDALKEITKSIELDGSDSKVFYWRGQINV